MAKEKWESDIVPGKGFTEPTYEFIHCEIVERSKLFGLNLATGTNCAVEKFGKPVKCEVNGIKKLCYETIHMYDNSTPEYKKK